MAFINSKHPDGLSTPEWTDIQYDNWIDTSWIDVDIGIGINSNGDLFTWGNNGAGEVGNGTTIVQVSPTQIGSYKWISVSGNGEARAAIRSDGSLWKWGKNDSGQLGNRTTYDRSSPVRIGTSSWTAIAVAPFHTAAIRSDGTLWMWGLNSYGQLGDGTTINKSSPVQIGTDEWTAVSVADYRTAAIRSDGALFVWGLNYNGSVGDGTVDNRSSPVQIGTSSWAAVSVGTNTTAAIRSDGALFTWGSNGSGSVYGMLGDGTTISKSSPVQIGTSSWIAVAVNRYVAGTIATAAVRADGQLFTTGYGPMSILYPGLGDGLNTSRSSFAAVGTLLWKTIRAGSGGFIGRLADGRTYAWGQYSGWYRRELAIPATSSTPREIISSTSSISRETILATKSDSTLWAWGDNIYGQLGDGTTISSTQGTSSSPSQIGTSSWISVSAHRGTVYAVADGGAMWKWGRKNPYFNFTDIDRSSPVTAHSGTWSAVHVGAQHAAAIASTGYVYTWGYNNTGQLGDGTTVNNSSPVLVHSSPVTKVRAVQINPGSSKSVQLGGQTFALGSTGILWGWGVNTTDGTTSYIGDGTTISRSSPVVISGTWLDFETQNSTDTNYYHMGVKSDYSLNNWPGTSSTAYAPYGFATTSFKFTSAPLSRSGTTHLGIDTYSRLVAITPSTALAAISTSFTNVKSVVARSYDVGYSDPLYDSIVVKNSTDPQTPNAVAIPYNIGTSPLVTGGSHSYLQGTYSPITLGARYYKYSELRDIYRNKINFAWAVGSGVGGRLGDGTTVNKSSPVLVSGAHRFTVIDSGDEHTMAIRSDGTLWAWGIGLDGKLGDGTTVNKSSPVQIGTSKWNAVTSGDYHTLAIKSDGTLWGWGYNGVGSIGDGTTIDKSSPVQIGSSSWTAVSSKSGHTLAIRIDGALFAWGDNSFGYLGDGTTIDKSSPVQIGSSSWIAVATGTVTSFAIRSDGALFAWGQNGPIATLGDGTTIDKSSPVQIGTSSWTAISIYTYNAVALRADGALFAWGYNQYGQVGDGTSGTGTHKSSPVQLGSLSWVAVSAGDNYAAAVRTDGSVWAWGTGTLGRLGTGSAGTINASPVQVSLATRVRSVSTGTSHTMFISE